MKHLNTRLPDETHAALEAMAAAERRSLNSMIIVLIEEGRQRRAEAVPPSARRQIRGAVRRD